MGFGMTYAASISEGRDARAEEYASIAKAKAIEEEVSIEEAKERVRESHSQGDEGWIKVGGRRRGSAIKKTAGMVSDSSRGPQGRQTSVSSSELDDNGSSPVKSDKTLEELYNERLSMGSREVSKDANRSFMVGSAVNRCSDPEVSSSLGSKEVPGDVSRSSISTSKPSVKSGSKVTSEDNNRSLNSGSVTACVQMKREREGGRAFRETNSLRRRVWESKESQRKFGSLRKFYTIFVDDLPSTIDTWWLRRLFKEFGAIVDAFIPRKTRAATNSKFGFVRFHYRCEAERAIQMMNGIRRQGAILKVSMAHFGRDMVTRFNEKVIWRPKKIRSIEVDNEEHSGSFNPAKMGCSYREAVTGRGLTGSNGDFAEECPNKAFEVLASRIAVLEGEVARLQQDLVYARSVGLLMKSHDASNITIEGKQREDESGGEGGLRSTIIVEQQRVEDDGGVGGIVRNSGVGMTDAEEIVNGRDREKTFLVADDGSVCESIGVTPKRLDQGVSCGSFSGERRPAGSGEGSVTGGFDIFNATGVWGSKFGNQEAATFDSVKGIIDDSEDEEALEELKLYRQYFDSSEDRKQKVCAFSKRDKKPVSVEMEGDRKSCFFANIKNRTKGQKKKEVESKKRRSYASSRWLGVKRRYVHVWL